MPVRHTLAATCQCSPLPYAASGIVPLKKYWICSCTERIALLGDGVNRREFLEFAALPCIRVDYGQVLR